MIGVPKVFATRQDWLNTHNTMLGARASGKADERDLDQFIERLTGLQNSKTMLVPKAGAVPSVSPNAPEGTEPQLQPSDFEPVNDPQSPFILSGLSDAEIASMIQELQSA